MPTTTEMTGDVGLDRVESFFLMIPDFRTRITAAIRQAFDEVIDGARTGRYCIEQLEKTEKTYIGTKIEIILRNEFGLERGSTLDNKICGNEVDTKFSLEGAWMIPSEAVNQICLLVKASDKSEKFGVGLIRATPENLTNGMNQDGKRTISARGRKAIRWLVEDGSMAPNFLLQLDAATRQIVLAPTSGKQRVLALLTHVTNRIIPRYAIEQVARLEDPLRRAREAKGILAKQGITVLCATYEADRSEMKARGFTGFNANDWLSLRDST